MRSLSCSSVRAILVVSLLSLASASASAASKAELVDRLQSASAKSTLNDPALKPWHLKLTVQSYDSAGKPAEAATIEQWTAGGDEKRVYTTPSASFTEIRHNGALFRVPGKPSPSYLLDLARLQVVDPIPPVAELNDSQPDARNERFGTVLLGCIMLDQPLKTIPVPPLGLFPTYCLEPETGLLRFSYLTGGLAITRNRLGGFQGRSIAIDTTINRGSQVIAKTHLESLGEWVADPAQFAIDATYSKVPTEIVHVAPAVMQANIMSAPPPIYTAVALRKLAYGTVVLRATIGADGHVRAVRLVSSPDPELASMAIAAVPQWTYKPYLVNGVPVEVETEVAVKCQY